MLIIHKIQSLFLRRTSRNHWRMWAQKPIQISKRAARTNHSQAKPSNLVILRPLANPWRLASRPPRLHHRTSLDLHQAFHLLLIFLEGWNIFLQKPSKSPASTTRIRNVWQRRNRTWKRFHVVANKTKRSLQKIYGPRKLKVLEKLEGVKMLMTL